MAQAPGNSRTLFNERMAPHHVEAEEAVLGSVLIDPGAFFAIAAFLRPEDFYIVRNQWIWEAFTALNDRKEAIDFLTVRAELENQAHLAEAGGPAYLTGLMNAVPTAIHAESYARIVEHAALRRRLLEAASQIAQSAYENDLDSDALASKAAQTLDEALARRSSQFSVSFKKAAGQFYESVLDSLDKPVERRVIPTGLIDLDNIVVGCWRKNYIVVAADTGMGKTAFLDTVLLEARRRGMSAVLWSGEMSREQRIQRLVSATLSDITINSHSLRLGQVTEQEQAEIAQALGGIERIPGLINDKPGIGIDELRLEAIRQKNTKTGLDILIVDHIHLMSGFQGKRYPNQEAEVRDISRGLKGLAMELGIPVLVAAQFNREVRNGARPSKHMLKYASQIEQDADDVWLIWDPDNLSPESEKNLPIVKREIIVDKQRNGPIGACFVGFFRERTRFVNLQTLDEGEI